MSNRKTSTPRWVSILRKLYTYIGGSGMFTAVSGKFGIDAETMLLIVEIYLMGQVAIQIIADTYYKPEKLPDFKPEKL